MSCNLQMSGLDDSFKKIIKPLLESDILFEMLKYSSDDALGKGVTKKEKLELINQGDKENRRVIFQPWKKDMVIDDERTELRIYLLSMNPTNRYIGKIYFGFDVFTHDNLWQLDEGRQRVLLMVQEIYKILNANEVDFLGKLEAENNRMQLRDFADGFTGYTFALSSGTT